MPKITKARGVTYEPVAVEQSVAVPAPESVPAASDPASRSADTLAAPSAPQAPAQRVTYARAGHAAGSGKANP